MLTAKEVLERAGALNDTDKTMMQKFLAVVAARIEKAVEAGVQLDEGVVRFEMNRTDLFSEVTDGGKTVMRKQAIEAAIETLQKDGGYRVGLDDQNLVVTAGAKRKGGRPKGSKNAPKPEPKADEPAPQAPAAEAPKPEAKPAEAPPVQAQAQQQGKKGNKGKAAA